MKKLVVIFLLLFSSQVWGATIYVDKTLVSDCSGGNYSIANRTCTGTDGKAYNTIQDVIWGTDGSNGAANVGDIILLRSGTYQEAWGTTGWDGAAMQFPSRLNGTAWTAGNYTTLASYDGEWAILDGQNGNYIAAVGLGTASSGSGNERRYWKLERLEIKNGSGHGIGVIEGPFWIRYCYIHDNGAGGIGDQNRSGLMLRRGMGNIIEYNYFTNNSFSESSDNGADIENYGDYYYNQYPPSSTNYPTANRDNEIRYNRFVAGPYNYSAYKDKATQYLQNYTYNGSVASTTYNEHGNKIHHNIATGQQLAFQVDQDFAQVYNNIADTSSIGNEAGSSFYPSFYNCYYNNTVINGTIAADTGWRRTTESSLTSALYMVNNINSNSSTYDHSPSFGIITGWLAENSCGSASFTWTGTTVDRNLVYQPQSSYHFGNPNTYGCQNATRWPSTSTFNTQQSKTNYTTDTAGLFLGTSGANKYRIDGSFVITGETTAANGGIGGAHPYLPGVTIPSYVGAVNPSDDSWVAGVLALDVTYFTSQANGSTPSWIEGTPADTDPPTISSKTISSNGNSITIVFNEYVTQGAGYNDSDVDIDCATAGNNIVLTYSSGNTTNVHVYTIASTILSGDTCNVDFNGDANSLEDSSGNDLAAVVSGAVTNSSTQAYPTFSSATIDTTGKILSVTFSADVRIGSGSYGGITVTSCSGGALTVSYTSNNGATVVYGQFSRTIEQGETGCVLGYTQPGNGIEANLSPNYLDVQTFSGQSITNNSTVTPVPSTPGATIGGGLSVGGGGKIQ
jgi:hypothetical protein